MKNFLLRLSLRKKLVYIFLLLTTFTLTTGVTSLYFLSRIRVNVEKTFNNEVKLMEVVNGISENIFKTNWKLYSVLNGRVRKDSYEIDMERVNRENKEYLSEFNNMKVNDDIALELEVFIEKYKKYDEVKAGVEEVIDISSSDRNYRVSNFDGGMDSLMSSLNIIKLESDKSLKDSENSINELVALSYIISLITMVTAVITSIVVGVVIASLTLKQVKKLNKVSVGIAEGDFSEDIGIPLKDELGETVSLLNDGIGKTRALLERVIHNVDNVDELSTSLIKDSSAMKVTFDKIVDSSMDINKSIGEIGSKSKSIVTEVEDVNDKVVEINKLAENGVAVSNSITGKVTGLMQDSKESIELAKNVYLEKQSSMQRCIANSKEIEKIFGMVFIIKDIANQTSILALNAAIEAAKAGENGASFEVIAKEIGVLSDRSTEMVDNIEKLVLSTKVSFDDVLSSSKDLLTFIDEKVMLDYSSFLNTVNEYNTDAIVFKEFSESLIASAEFIAKVMESIVSSMTNVYSSVEEVTANSDIITNSMGESKNLVVDIDTVIKGQGVYLNDLTKLVSGFKINK